MTWTDYGARWYMPEIGRWNAVDPLASARSWVSPYNYVQNDPISRLDPDGRFDCDFPPPGFCNDVDRAWADSDGVFNREAGEENWQWTSPEGIDNGIYIESEVTITARSGGGFFAWVDRLLGRIPAGTSTNYEDSPNSHVDSGVEILTNDPLTSTGGLPLSSGNSEAIIEMGDFLNPTDAGGVLGDAANALGPLTRIINNAGHAINNGSGAVESIGNAPKDTTILNVKGGKNIYTKYNTEDFKKKGDYKNK